MWFALGIVIVVALSLIAGGSWGVYKITRDIGIVPTFVIVGGIGAAVSVALMVWGACSSATGKIKNPILSTLSVFFILFLAICVVEGLVYGAYSLIAPLCR